MGCMVVDSRIFPNCMFDILLPHTALPAESIERSADLVEPVFQVRAMVAPRSTDGDLVVP